MNSIFPLLFFVSCTFLSCTSGSKVSDNSYVDNRDGHSYKTVKIGKQLWMAENLAYLPFVCQSTIGSSANPLCYIYGYEGTNIDSAKSSINFKTYGVLYNWTAAINSCPTGWQLPTASQWEIMENYLKDNGIGYNIKDNYFTGKSLASTWGWDSGFGTKLQNQVGNDLTVNNQSGFTAIPGGMREESSFWGINIHAFFWSSSNITTLNKSLQNELKEFNRVNSVDSLAFCFDLASYGVFLDKVTYTKETGMSVRCIKKN